MASINSTFQWITTHFLGNPMTTQHEKAKRWRPWRFSIMSLLIATAFCAVMVAWWRDRTLLLQEIDALRTDNQRAAIGIKAANDEVDWMKKDFQSLREEFQHVARIQSRLHKEKISKLEAKLKNARPGRPNN